MDILLFFLYFLSFFPGFASLVLCAVSYAKDRDPLTKRYVAAYLPISLVMFISLLTYYFSVTAPVDYPYWIDFALIVARVFLLGLAVYAVPRFVHGLAGVPMGKSARTAFIALMAVSIAPPFVINALPGGNKLIFGYFINLSPVFLYASIVYSAIVLIRRRKGAASPEKRLFLRGFAIISLCAAPLLAFQILNNSRGFIAGKYRFYLEYLYFSAWSSFHVFYLIRTSLLPPNAARAAKAETRTAKYEKSGLPAAEADRLKAVIEAEMSGRRAYRDPDLALDDFAARCGVPRAWISQVLNVRMGKGFYDYANEFRLAEAMAMLADPAGGKGVLEIAYEAGFNSKSAFYAAFRKRTGMSPAGYRELILGPVSGPARNGGRPQGSGRGSP